MTAPDPVENEAARLAALDATGLLDTQADTAFGTVVELVSTWLGVPVAAVSFVDAEREWFKAQRGLGLRQLGRAGSFGEATLARGGLLVVEDAQQDPRFAAHPLVAGQERIRFYAGVPIRTSEGYAVGVLCAMDSVGRTLSAEQRGFLEVVASQLSHLVELRAHEAARDRAVLQFADRTNLAYCVVGVGGTVVWANASALEIFGYARATVIGSPIASLFVDPRRFHLVFDALSRGEVVRGAHASVLHRDGSARSVEIDGHSGVDAHGAWLGHVVLRDVTRQTQQWRALGAYSSLFDVTLDLVCTADEGLYFTLLNPAWTAVLGWSLDELRAEPFTSFVHPDDLAETEAVAARLLEADGELVDFRNRYRCRDGSYRTLSWLSRAVNGTFVASARDITDQVAQQEALRQQHEVLRTISEAQAFYIDRGDHAALWDFVIDAVLSITQSSFGLVATPGRDAGGDYLRVKSLGHLGWDAGRRAVLAARYPDGLEVRSLDNLVGRAVLSGVRVTAGPDETEMLRQALPAGHAEVKTFAGLPLHDGSRVVGVVALANREGGYDDACLDAVAPLLAFIASVMRSIGLSEQRHAAEARLLAVVNSAQDVVVTFDATGRIESVNRAARTMLGREPEALVGLPLATILRDSDARDVLRGLHGGQRASDSSGSPREVFALRADGTEFEAEASVGSFSMDGTTLYTAFVRDVTARKHEAALKAQVLVNKGLETVVGELQQNQHERELVSECVELIQSSTTLDEGVDVLALFSERIFADGEVGCYVGAPDAGELLLRPAGRKTADGTAPSWLNPGDCWAVRTRRVHAWTRGGIAPACRHAVDDRADSRFCMPIFALDHPVALLTVGYSAPAELGGAQVQFESRASRYASAAQGISGAFSTVALQESLARLALMDELTGLSNRRAFEREAQRTIAMLRRAGRPYAVAMFDVDHFKSVNDAFGHEGGDRVLRMVARVLRNGTRESDLLARWGGEEFVLLLCDTGEAGMLERLTALLDAVRRTCRLQTRSVTVSIGAVHSAALPDQTLASLLRCADQALYAAKSSGRDRVVTHDPAQLAGPTLPVNTPSPVEPDVESR